MSGRPIDWRAVALARRSLAAIAARRPDLLGEPSEANRAGWEAALAEQEDESMATNPIMIRLDPELLARVDAHAERLRALVPGVALTRSDAIRALLVAALDQAEASARRARKRT